jgi:hypothetical protein
MIEIGRCTLVTLPATADRALTGRLLQSRLAREQLRERCSSLGS